MASWGPPPDPAPTGTPVRFLLGLGSLGGSAVLFTHQMLSTARVFSSRFQYLWLDSLLFRGHVKAFRARP